MNVDTLEQIAEYVERYGFTVHLTDVSIEDHWDPIELSCVGGDVAYAPGRREVSLNIQATLLETNPASNVDELKEAIRRFDASVKQYEDD